MDRKKAGFGLAGSALLFGSASLLMILETRLLIPLLSARTGLEPGVLWFIVAGLGLFLPLLAVALVVVKKEGLVLDGRTWRDRLRFRKLNGADWLWSIAAVLVIGASSFAIMKLLELSVGQFESRPPFMHFEPLRPGRYRLLLLWLPYWLANIMGEEILWRGVVLPRQEAAFGARAWLVHGIFWGVFHVAFGWQIVLTLLPVLFVQPYVVQRRRNSWIGVIIHALMNGPSFLAMAFGLI